MDQLRSFIIVAVALGVYFLVGLIFSLFARRKRIRSVVFMDRLSNGMFEIKKGKFDRLYWLVSKLFFQGLMLYSVSITASLQHEARNTALIYVVGWSVIIVLFIRTLRSYSLDADFVFELSDDFVIINGERHERSTINSIEITTFTSSTGLTAYYVNLKFRADKILICETSSRNEMEDIVNGMYHALNVEIIDKAEYVLAGYSMSRKAL